MLHNLAYPDRRATATGQTLEFVADRMLSPIQGRRSDAVPLVVVFLGAEAQDGMAAVQAGAAALRAQGARVIVVGPGASISSQLEDEMLTIASTPSDVYDLDTLETLAAQGVNVFTSQFMSGLFCAAVSSSAVVLPVPSSSQVGVGASSTQGGLVSLTAISQVSQIGRSSTVLFTQTPSPSAVFGSSSTVGAGVSSPGVSLFSPAPLTSLGGSGVLSAASSLGASNTVEASAPPSPAPSSSLGGSVAPSAITSIGGSMQPTAATSLVSPTATPVPQPVPPYCQAFVPTDVVVVLSASGKTGQALFDRFRSLSMALIRQLPANGFSAK